MNSTRTADEDRHYDNLATQRSKREEAEFQLGAAQAERIEVSGCTEPNFDIPVTIS